MILQCVEFEEGAKSSEGDRSRSAEENRRIDLGIDQADNSRFIVVYVIPQLGHYPRMGAQVGFESLIMMH